MILVLETSWHSSLKEVVFGILGISDRQLRNKQIRQFILVNLWFLWARNKNLNLHLKVDFITPQKHFVHVVDEVEIEGIFCGDFLQFMNKNHIIY